MKSIEQKLKQDAQVFKQQPDASLHENIMANIECHQKTENININKSKKSFNIYQWLIPTGFAVATLFFVALNLHQPTSVNDNINLESSSLELLAMTEIKFDLFPQVLEAKLIDPIKAEQQAIEQDLQYLKGLFVL